MDVKSHEEELAELERAKAILSGCSVLACGLILIVASIVVAVCQPLDWWKCVLMAIAGVGFIYIARTDRRRQSALRESRRDDEEDGEQESQPTKSTSPANACYTRLLQAIPFVVLLFTGMIVSDDYRFI